MLFSILPEIFLKLRCSVFDKKPSKNQFGRACISNNSQNSNYFIKIQRSSYKIPPISLIFELIRKNISLNSVTIRQRMKFFERNKQQFKKNYSFKFKIKDFPMNKNNILIAPTVEYNYGIVEINTLLKVPVCLPLKMLRSKTIYILKYYCFIKTPCT